MLSPSSIGFISIAMSAVTLTAAAAGSVLTQKDATDRVRSQGYALVSKAEQVPGAWDVWASKDGIPYEIKIDAHSGSVIATTPVEDND